MSKVTKREWTTKDGKKSTRWIIDYKDDNGKRYKKSGFKTKVEAEKALTEIIHTLNSTGHIIKNSKMLFLDAVKLYLEMYVEINCKKSTSNEYKQILYKHVVPILGNIMIKDLDSLTIQSLIHTKKTQGLSNYRINDIIKVLKSMFSMLQENNLIIKNPTKNIKKLSLPHKEMKFLNKQEINQLLQVTRIEYPDFYPLLFTAIFTGLRQGEILALTWNDIDFNKRKIRVNKNFTKGNLTTPKTKSSIRYIEMTGELIKTLKEWKIRCLNNELGLVFPNEIGGYINPSNLIRRRFKPALKKAKIKDIRWHDLRHTYASLLVEKNITTKYIQKQLGHSSIQQTMDRYAHLLPDVTDSAIQALDSYLDFSNKTIKKIV